MLKNRKARMRSKDHLSSTPSQWTRGSRESLIWVKARGKGSDSTVVPTIEERLMADGTIPVNGRPANGESSTHSHEDVKKSLAGKMSINPWQVHCQLAGD